MTRVFDNTDRAWSLIRMSMEYANNNYVSTMSKTVKLTDMECSLLAGRCSTVPILCEFTYDKIRSMFPR
jgi:hypothetical protein